MKQYGIISIRTASGGWMRSIQAEVFEVDGTKFYSTLGENTTDQYDEETMRFEPFAAREQKLERFAHLIKQHLPDAEFGYEALDDQELETLNDAEEEVAGIEGKPFVRLVRIPEEIDEELDRDGMVTNSFQTIPERIVVEGSEEHLEYLRTRQGETPYFNND